MPTMASNSISSATVLHWLELCAATFQQHKDELTQLDSAIGDADHGANMARGFNAVQAKLSTLKDQDIGAIFKAVAMVLISTVGGASGPLYGTFFLQASVPTAGKRELSALELGDAFQAGLDGLMKRGKADTGEKTMVDALVPALKAWRASAEESPSAAISSAVQAARQGAEATVPLVATKGRASYLGERGAGHMDPGARSSVLLLEALQESISAAV